MGTRTKILTTLDHNVSKRREIGFRQFGDASTLEAIVNVELHDGYVSAGTETSILLKSEMDAVITNAGVITPNQFWSTMLNIFNEAVNKISD